MGAPTFNPDQDAVPTPAPAVDAVTPTTVDGTTSPAVEAPAAETESAG